MQETRIHNFNAGPAAIPLPVLEEVQKSFLNINDTGMSVCEISHRSKVFDEIMNDTVARTKRLLGLGDDYEVLFIQGGASLQFCMIPMNFLPEGASADYVNTGTWSTKAIAEARKQGKSINVVASSEEQNFACIPKTIKVSEKAAYLHLTSNNTIKGTQWETYPQTQAVPLIADMSSDIMCRPIDITPFGLIYAGAQKNIGPAGVCMVIIRKDMLEKCPDSSPSMLNYTTYSSKNSMYNTPPCLAIYMVNLVMKWLEDSVGGLAKMEAINRTKAQSLYGLLDSSDFYQGTAAEDSRSIMNVTFRLPNENLEQKFIQAALDHGMGGLKGHRSVGGCRASIYNATSIEAVNALVDFMKTFEKEN